MQKQKFTIASQAEKWRFECRHGEEPGEGHTTWFPINGHFRCRACADLRRTRPEITPEYDYLRDKITGELVSREQVVLATDPDPLPVR